MKRALLLLAVGAALVAVAAPGWAQPQMSLAWGSCSHAGFDQFNLASAPTRVATMVVLATNITDNNAATDLTVDITGLDPLHNRIGIPDAWRFDDTGCQTASQILFQASAFSKSCPILQGTAPLAITNYGYNPADGHVDVRLANTYNTFTPTPATVYTIWKVSFDHSFSDMVDPVEVDSCAGGRTEVQLQINRTVDFHPVLLTELGPLVDFVEATPGDWFLGFNAPPVPAHKTTWSSVKGMYR